MDYQLENEEVKIIISPKGGELKSFYGKKAAQEYLWPGDEQYWEDSAPNLFPYIARLTKGIYQYQKKEYHLPIHGFVKARELAVTKSQNELVFELIADEETQKSYPFLFNYRVRYRLQKSELLINYEVENQDHKTMYFGIGGHPGFLVPFITNTVFEDYCIEFESGVQPTRVLFSKDCFVTGEQTFADLQGSVLPLTHQLFDQDAIVLKDAGKKVILRTNQKGTRIVVTFPQMNYLGIWHTPKTKAPFVCIEPWSSLPSREGIVEDLEKQENLMTLLPGETYEANWMISLMNYP